MPFSVYPIPIRVFVMLLAVIPGDVNGGHLVEVMSNRPLHYYHFSFVMNKSLVRR